MQPSEFIPKALRTEAYNMEAIQSRLTQTSTIRLMHGAIGISTEAGEITDALKKHIFYGKPLDRVNLKEEIGDVLWYIAIMCDELGVSMEECMDKVIAKLAARYPEKFTEDKAINRDLGTERAVLEQQ